MELSLCKPQLGLSRAYTVDWAGSQLVPSSHKDISFFDKSVRCKKGGFRVLKNSTENNSINMRGNGFSIRNAAQRTNFAYALIPYNLDSLSGLFPNPMNAENCLWKVDIPQACG